MIFDVEQLHQLDDGAPERCGGGAEIADSNQAIATSVALYHTSQGPSAWGSDLVEYEDDIADVDGRLIFFPFSTSLKLLKIGD